MPAISSRYGDAAEFLCAKRAVKPVPADLGRKTGARKQSGAKLALEGPKTNADGVAARAAGAENCRTPSKAAVYPNHPAIEHSHGVTKMKAKPEFKARKHQPGRYARGRIRTEAKPRALPNKWASDFDAVGQM